MTVGKLIEELKKYPPDMEVVFGFKNTQTIDLTDYEILNDGIKYEFDDWLSYKNTSIQEYKYKKEMHKVVNVELEY